MGKSRTTHPPVVKHFEREMFTVKFIYLHSYEEQAGEAEHVLML